MNKTENRLDQWYDIIHHMNHDPMNCNKCSKDCVSCRNQIENSLKLAKEHLERLKTVLAEFEARSK